MGTESKVFQESIKAYLDERAKADELFAKNYAKEGKSLEECCKYIIGEAFASKCIGFANDEIFGHAVHYYDEDNIKVKPLPSNVGVRIKVNHHIDPPKEEPKPSEPKKEEKPKTAKPSEPTIFDKPKEQPKAGNEKKKAKPKKNETKPRYVELSLFD